MNTKFYLKNCIDSAVAGGKAISKARSSLGKTKGDRAVGHHAIVSNKDFISQRAILANILNRDPDARFMTEEHVRSALKGRLVTADRLSQLRTGRAYIIDELDGTSSNNIGHYEWSTSVGLLDQLESAAGAVYAPKISGGTLFYGSKGEGSFVKDGENMRGKRMNVSTKGLGDAYVIMGVDCVLTKYPIHNRLLTEIGDQARTTNSNGSCALALGLVASGRADALVQPLQSPWDWTAGKCLVEEAGGEMIFYEMNGGKVTPVEKPVERHYNPDVRGVGFVAGNRDLARRIFDILIKIN